MSEVVKTAKFATIYLLGVVLNRSISFIMLPIYTRFLSTADYGIIELLTMTTDVFGLVAAVGLTSALYRFFYSFDNKSERNEVVSTISILMILFYFLSSVIGFLMSGELADIVLQGRKEDIYYFQLMFIILFFQAFIEIPLIFVKAQQRPYFFVFISAGRLLLQLTLNIYFVVYLKMHVQGVLYSTLIANFIIGLVLITYTFRTVGVGFSKTLAKSMVAFGAPLLLADLGSFVVSNSDKYFLKIYTSLSEVGIYSLGYKLGFILWAFTVIPIFNIWGPQRFEIAKKPDAQSINNRVFFFYNLLIVSFALGLSLFSLDLFRIMSHPSFWGAFKIVPLIMIAFIIYSWNAFCNFGLYYADKTKYFAIGTLTSALVMVVSCMVLIPRFHSYGAAVSTICAFVVRFGIIYYYSQKYYRLKLPWGKNVLILISAAVIYCISLCFIQEDVYYSIILNMLLFFIFLVSMLIAPVFEKSEKKMILNYALHPISTLRSAVSITK